MYYIFENIPLNFSANRREKSSEILQSVIFPLFCSTDSFIHSSQAAASQSRAMVQQAIGRTPLRSLLLCHGSSQAFNAKKVKQSHVKIDRQPNVRYILCSGSSSTCSYTTWRAPVSSSSLALSLLY